MCFDGAGEGTFFGGIVGNNWTGLIVSRMHDTLFSLVVPIELVMTIRIQCEACDLPLQKRM